MPCLKIFSLGCHLFQRDYIWVETINSKNIYAAILDYLIKEFGSGKEFLEVDLIDPKASEFREKFDYAFSLTYKDLYNSHTYNSNITFNNGTGNTITTNNSQGLSLVFDPYVEKAIFGIKIENPREVRPEDYKKYLTSNNKVLRSLAKKLY